MGHYPIFLELRERRCLVIGGGTIAERKVHGLLAAEATVTVVSPQLTPLLTNWSQQGAIQHIARAYRNGDLDGYHLVFVATDDGVVNAAVAREGREREIWVNAADDPAYCDFILPAVVQRGALSVAVATGGTSPALTRAIREELQEYFTADYSLLATVAAAVRLQLRADKRTVPGACWVQALRNEKFRDLVRAGLREEATGWLLEKLREEP
ncbi:MAG: bifunctional precorrin-2 dehydrogenase/sirohydrochlorin ferrochelatase [Deltaproteobacteria bacterium]|nr:bifunctional precorrin-2 dehydrogenase/sirohydrochlorin ferrochelatase [Deltaproteobacteria bacterium]